MQHFIRISVVLTFALIGSLGSAQTPGGGDAGRGKKLFMEDGCYFCHGQDGHRAGQAGKLAPKPIPLAAATAYVRNPKGQMIPYSAKVLPDADLADIWAYLRTIPDNPAPESIPILKNW